MKLRITFFSCLFIFQLNQVSAQLDCGISTAQIDLNGNNVKTRLLVSGDLWWDGRDGKYQVEINGPSVPTPSALYAGGVWMGGFSPSGELKIAASTYGRARGITDYFPGPLDVNDGSTDATTCQNWDRFFKVKKSKIEEHLNLWQQGNYTEDQIPFSVKTWPARGNPFFEATFGFELPDTPQGLADFWDENTDGIYNPLDGDYPTLLQRGCDIGTIPDEMIFWIFNDGGGTHDITNGNPMQMEFQVTAFAFKQDNFENSTFYRYKLINRSSETLNDAYFGMWADPDLGCYTDDYFGSDSLRNMWYLYNEDEFDGDVGCTCPQGILTYCDEIPLVGMDIFRGPLDAGGNELGMSSFTYHHNPALWGGPAAMTDPTLDAEYYNYLTGKWSDGTPYTVGGSGYLSGNQTTNFAFSGYTDLLGWSMCTAGLPSGDHRIVQATGPMVFPPGSSNELILGVIFVPNVQSPCPALDKLNNADDIIQFAFDNCLEQISPSKEYNSTNLEAIVLSPNPFSKDSHMELTISNLPQKSTIRIFDINGKLIEDIGQVDNTSINWTPDFSLHSGVYFVEVQDQNARKVLKWVYSK